DNRAEAAARRRAEPVCRRPHGRLDRACHRAVSKRDVDPAARPLYRGAARARGVPRLNMPAPSAAADWPDDIFAALQTAEIRQIGYVPDAGHSRLIELCQAD